VFTNGKKADKIYRRLVDRRLSPELRSPVTCLPSTSPANTIPLGRKMEEWKVVRTFVESD
jgi:G:T/U-mismatch repair DNA glycosylase